MGMPIARDMLEKKKTPQLMILICQTPIAAQSTHAQGIATIKISCPFMKQKSGTNV